MSKQRPETLHARVKYLVSPSGGGYILSKLCIKGKCGRRSAVSVQKWLDDPDNHDLTDEQRTGLYQAVTLVSLEKLDSAIRMAATNTIPIKSNNTTPDPVAEKSQVIEIAPTPVEKQSATDVAMGSSWVSLTSTIYQVKLSGSERKRYMDACRTCPNLASAYKQITGKTWDDTIWIQSRDMSTFQSATTRWPSFAVLLDMVMKDVHNRPPERFSVRCSLFSQAPSSGGDHHPHPSHRSTYSSSSSSTAPMKRKRSPDDGSFNRSSRSRDSASSSRSSSFSSTRSPVRWRQRSPTPVHHSHHHRRQDAATTTSSSSSSSSSSHHRHHHRDDRRQSPSEYASTVSPPPDWRYSNNMNYPVAAAAAAASTAPVSTSLYSTYGAPHTVPMFIPLPPVLDGQHLNRPTGDPFVYPTGR